MRLIHGDFTPWNLLFQDGQLSGLLDFGLSRPDLLLADFCLSWRGQYDEVSHLLGADWPALTPVSWVSLLELAYRDLSRRQVDNGWVIKMLLRRSPLISVGPYKGQ